MYRLCAVACALVVALAAATPAAASQKGYTFFWEAPIGGHGYYRAWTGDVTGDGFPDLIVQVAADSHSLERHSVMHIFSRFVLIHSGDFPAVLAVADLNGDGVAEIVTADRQVWHWSKRGAELVRDPKAAAKLARYEGRHVLPRYDFDNPAEFLVDCDGDGGLDRASLSTAGGFLHVVVEGRRGLVGEIRQDIASEGLCTVFPVQAGGSRGFFAQTPGPGQGATWSLWLYGRSGYELAWQAAREPADRLAWGSFDGGQHGLVTASGGVLEAWLWRDGALARAWRSEDHGGLGFEALYILDLDGNGKAEIIARHIHPTVWSHDLLVYRWLGAGAELAARIEDIGHWAGATAVSADFLGVGRPQVMLGLDFDPCRPCGFGFKIDPTASPGLMARLGASVNLAAARVAMLPMAVPAGALLALGVLLALGARRPRRGRHARSRYR